MIHINTLLKTHNIICWDIDNTLINGVNSHIFRKYVLDHPEKIHIIVTFRCDEYDIENIEGELSFPEDNFGIHLFDEIITMPKEYDVRLKYKNALEKEHLSAEEFYIQTGFDKSIMLNEIKRCEHYKAISCKKVGSSVLIDDLYDLLIDSFIEHNLLLIDALDINIYH